MLLIAIALQLVSAAATDPRPINTDESVQLDDYPQEALRNAQTGIVTAAVSVAEDGRVTGCDVVESSHFASLDSATCGAIRRRGRFAPATDDTGRSIKGVYYRAVSWGVGADQPRTIMDLTLMTQNIPPGYANPAMLQAVFGPSGHIVRCKIENSTGNTGADSVACRQAIATIAIAPPITRNGSTPLAVRSVIVTFRAQ
ncbi:energy transducer TonB [Sphingomonas sp. R86520]|uniref:energy transducer TonB n=1 Tax=Sphingomonas sp. R86520 TaxID=3093859 RepID=UPI0036D25E7C